MKRTEQNYIREVACSRHGYDGGMAYEELNKPRPALPAWAKYALLVVLTVSALGVAVYALMR